MLTSVSELTAVTELHPAFADAIAALPAHKRHPDTDEELRFLLLDAAQEAPGLETALASHLGFLLNSLDIGGLRRWILTGLRLYPNHPGQLAAYFRLEDADAAQAMVAEAKGTSFERARHALQYFTTGFGQLELSLAARRQRRLNALPLRVRKPLKHPAWRLRQGCLCLGCRPIRSLFCRCQLDQAHNGL